MGLLGFFWYSKPVKRLKSTVTYALPSDDIWERDWDVLVVLDACRADLFAETIEPTPTLVSPAATSATWIRRVFDRDVSDIGYVTGNGHIDEIPIDDFAYFHVQPTERPEYGVETVPPSPLVDQAVHAWRNRSEYGLNRLVVHFMQPHAPFRSRPEWFPEDRGGISAFVWQRLKRGEFAREEVWEAYRDNLQWVWDDAVSVLRRNMDADIVVSADHGNALGEWGCYGHPMGCPADAVREVPWYEISGTDEQTYQPEIERANVEIDRDDHLRALGYL